MALSLWAIVIFAVLTLVNVIIFTLYSGYPQFFFEHAVDKSSVNATELKRFVGDYIYAMSIWDDVLAVALTNAVVIMQILSYKGNDTELKVEERMRFPFDKNEVLSEMFGNLPIEFKLTSENELLFCTIVKCRSYY